MPYSRPKTKKKQKDWKMSYSQKMGGKMPYSRLKDTKTKFWL